jgi:YegS/Rv2252/BmrU family lipid kinase
MKTVIIANPRAAAWKVQKQWRKLNQAIVACFGPSEVHFTQAPLEATQLCRRAIREGAERIVAIGGDGTLNEVVNGFFDGEYIGEKVVLAYYPVGTGGDFARSAGLCRKDVEQALHVSEVRRIDIGRATFKHPDGTPAIRYFANISSFGMSGVVDQMINRGGKHLGGKLSFMWNTLLGMAKYQNQRVRLRIDEIFDEEVLINTVAVANGRFFGGGMQIAPHALLNDGLFDVIVVGDLKMLRFIANSHKLYRGTHLGLPSIRAFQGRRVVATPLEGPVFIDADGEQPGILPVEYEILPKKLAMYAPWSQAPAFALTENLQKQRENLR